MVALVGLEWLLWSPGCYLLLEKVVDISMNEGCGIRLSGTSRFGPSLLNQNTHGNQVLNYG